MKIAEQFKFSSAYNVNSEMLGGEAHWNMPPLFSKIWDFCFIHTITHMEISYVSISLTLFYEFTSLGGHPDSAHKDHCSARYCLPGFSESGFSFT